MLNEIQFLKNLIKKSKGADYLEANYFSFFRYELSARKNIIKDMIFFEDKQVTIKAWIGKKQGIYSCNFLDKEAVNKAIELAKKSKPLGFFYGLPKKQKYKKNKGICQKVLGVKKMADLAKKIISFTADKNTYVEGLCFSSGGKKHILINSNGIEAKEKTASISFEISLVSKKNKETTSYGNGFNGRKLINLKKFCQKTKQEVLNLLEAKSLKEKPEIIILEPRVLADLFENAFLDNFLGMNVIKKRSMLKDKLNKKIISEKITLIDNGIINGGVKSSSFDSEGIPSQKTVLVKNGVLKNFIHNYNTACHLKAKPTGNADGFSNIIIESGKENLIKKFIQSKKKVLLIKTVIGAHTANSITSAFSVKTTCAYLIKEGKIEPIKDVMISGKMIDLLNNVLMIDKKIENFYGFYFPAIAFSDGFDIGF